LFPPVVHRTTAGGGKIARACATVCCAMEAPAEDPKAWRGLAVRANRKPLNITSLRRAHQPNSLAPPWMPGCALPRSSQRRPDAQ